MNDRKVRGLSGATILTFVVFLFVMLWITNQFDQKEEEINWKDFEELVTSDELGKVVVNQNKNVPTGRVEIELKDKEGELKYLYVSDVNQVQDYLKEKNISYEMPDVHEDSWFITLVMPVALKLLGVMLIFTVMNRQSGGANAKAMNFGKSRARMSVGGDKDITFSKVAGLKEEKEELEEIVDFLKSPKKYIQVGARIPKGVLLVGPPRRECRSLPYQAQTLWRCSWVWAPPVSVICSRRLRRILRVLSLLTRLTPWQDGEAPEWAAAMTRESRR